MSDNKRNKNLHSTPLVCKAGLTMSFDRQVKSCDSYSALNIDNLQLLALLPTKKIYSKARLINIVTIKPKHSNILLYCTKFRTKVLYAKEDGKCKKLK